MPTGVDYSFLFAETTGNGSNSQDAMGIWNRVLIWVQGKAVSKQPLPQKHHLRAPIAPLSSHSEQGCLESSHLLHTHVALAGKRFNYDDYY